MSDMDQRPDFAAFAAVYERGQAQVLATSLLADLDTPVSAMLKLAEGRPYSFLLESVTGGAVRGRYSILGTKPDLVWRCRGSYAEINRQARADRDAFVPEPLPALDSLRALKVVYSETRNKGRVTYLHELTAIDLLVEERSSAEVAERCLRRRKSAPNNKTTRPISQ